jgi:hypothetical protein
MESESWVEKLSSVSRTDSFSSPATAAGNKKAAILSPPTI